MPTQRRRFTDRVGQYWLKLVLPAVLIIVLSSAPLAAKPRYGGYIDILGSRTSSPVLK